MFSVDQNTRNFINLNTLKMKKETDKLLQNKALNISVVMPRFFIRSKTNAGEFTKQSFLAITSDTTESALIIRKLVLTDNFELYRNFKLIKKYKGRGLFEQRFSIKLSTLSTVIASLNGAITDSGILHVLFTD